MSSMQKFYQMLSKRDGTSGPFWEALTAITRIPLEQLKAWAGDLGWQLWSARTTDTRAA